MSRKNKARIFVGLQIAIMLFMFIRLFFPLKDIELDLSLFQLNEDDGSSFEEGIILFKQQEEIIEANPSIDLGKFNAGAYEINIKYKSNKDGSMNYMNKTGSIGFSSKKNREGVFSETIVLNDADEVVSGRFYIRNFSMIDDLKMSVLFLGEGEVEISSIDIKESLEYRILDILKMLLILVGINVICYLIFSEERTYFSKYKYQLYIVIIALVASLPFINDYLIYEQDLYFHMGRIVSIARELGNGQFPVRISTEMLNDYGYVTSLFYPDFFLYVPAILYKMMLPLRNCYQVYVIIINMATAYISFYSFKRITKDDSISLVGTMVYVLATYRIINIWSRAAVGEYTSMTFLPLVVLGIYLIYTTEKPRWREWGILAIAMSGIISSHILSVQMVLIFLVMAVIIMIRKTLKIEVVLAYVKAVVLTIMLTAWFVIPMLQSSSMSLRVFENKENNIQSHGLYIMQLFGFFQNTTGKSEMNTMTVDMPLSIGLSLTIGLIAIIYCLFTNKKNNGKEYKILKLVFSLGIVSLLFTLHNFPWVYFYNWFGEDVQLFFSKIQFPWRYMSISTILISVGIVLTLVMMKKNSNNIYKPFIMVLITSTVLTTGYYASDSSINGGKIEFTDIRHGDMVSISAGEYLLNGSNQDSIYISNITKQYEELVINDYKKENGIAYIDLINDTDKTVAVTLPIFSYNNYHAYHEESDTEIGIIGDANNQVVLVIPPGLQGMIRVQYEPPKLWRLAELVSLITMIGCLVFLISNKYMKGKTK